jgi:hypothetical protein
MNVFLAFLILEMTLEYLHLLNGLLKMTLLLEMS